MYRPVEIPGQGRIWRFRVLVILSGNAGDASQERLVTCVCRACLAAVPSLTYLAVCLDCSETLAISPGADLACASGSDPIHLLPRMMRIRAWRVRPYRPLH